MNLKLKYVVMLLSFTLLIPGMGQFQSLSAVEAEQLRPVADVSIGSMGISFMPAVNYYQLVLTVSSPDGEVARKVYTAGSSPYFSLGDFQSRNYADGSYTYELRVIPSAQAMVRKSGSLGNEAVYAHALTQTGSFNVLGGGIVVPVRGDEGLARTQDIIHNDDVIITFSLCVGNDCVNGESFGFDTIRLKENNLRMHFDDTSTSSSFPKNDWRIVINDSSNGGASYFGVEDSTAGRRPFTIEAGAPANTLYVDSAKRIGIGTSTPAVDIHSVSGNTPTLRLEQDGSSGFTPQTWDVAGNETNFFVRDATNGSKLPFKIKPGAPDNALFVAASGDVGLGETSPDFSFHIKRGGTDNAGILLEQTGGSGEFKLQMTSAQGQIGTKSSHKLNIVTANANRIVILDDGKVGIGNFNPIQAFQVGSNAGAYCDGSTWQDVSSIELKDNVRPLGAEDAVSAFKALKPVRYVYKASKDEERIGFIAENVPELVANNTRKSLNSLEFTALLTRVVQEQQKSIEALKVEIAQLKKEK